MYEISKKTRNLRLRVMNPSHTNVGWMNTFLGDRVGEY